MTQNAFRNLLWFGALYCATQGALDTWDEALELLYLQRYGNSITNVAIAQTLGVLPMILKPVMAYPTDATRTRRPFVTFGLILSGVSFVLKTLFAPTPETFFWAYCLLLLFRNAGASISDAAQDGLLIDANVDELSGTISGWQGVGRMGGLILSIIVAGEIAAPDTPAAFNGALVFLGAWCILSSPVSLLVVEELTPSPAGKILLDVLDRAWIVGTCGAGPALLAAIGVTESETRKGRRRKHGGGGKAEGGVEDYVTGARGGNVINPLAVGAAPASGNSAGAATSGRRSTAFDYGGMVGVGDMGATSLVGLAAGAAAEVLIAGSHAALSAALPRVSATPAPAAKPRASAGAAGTSPRQPRATPPPPPGTLPEGWIESADPSGVPFYYNAATNVSQYEHPNPPREAGTTTPPPSGGEFDGSEYATVKDGEGEGEGDELDDGPPTPAAEGVLALPGSAVTEEEVSLQTLLLHVAKPPVAAFVAYMFFGQLATYIASFPVVIWLEEVHGFSVQDVGYLTIAGAFGNAFGGYAGGWFYDWCPSKRTSLLLVSLISGAPYFLFVAVTGQPLLYVSWVVIQVGYGALYAVQVSQIRLMADKRVAATFSGLCMGMLAVANAIGNIVGAAIAEEIGYNEVYITGAIMCLAGAALVPFITAQDPELDELKAKEREAERARGGGKLKRRPSVGRFLAQLKGADAVAQLDKVEANEEREWFERYKARKAAEVGLAEGEGGGEGDVEGSAEDKEDPIERYWRLRDEKERARSSGAAEGAPYV